MNSEILQADNSYNCASSMETLFKHRLDPGEVKARSSFGFGFSFVVTN